MYLGQAVNVVQQGSGGVVDERLGHRLIRHPGQDLLLRPETNVPRLEGELGIGHDWKGEKASIVTYSQNRKPQENNWCTDWLTMSTRQRQSTDDIVMWCSELAGDRSGLVRYVGGLSGLSMNGDTCSCM